MSFRICFSNKTALIDKVKEEVVFTTADNEYIERVRSLSRYRLDETKVAPMHLAAVSMSAFEKDRLVVPTDVRELGDLQEYLTEWWAKYEARHFAGELTPPSAPASDAARKVFMRMEDEGIV